MQDPCLSLGLSPPPGLVHHMAMHVVDQIRVSLWIWRTKDSFFSSANATRAVQLWLVSALPCVGGDKGVAPQCVVWVARGWAGPICGRGAGATTHIWWAGGSDPAGSILGEGGAASGAHRWIGAGVGGGRLPRCALGLP